MKIVVDNSGYGLDNIGDVAMLQMAIIRLQQLLPQAMLQIFTWNPNELLQFGSKVNSIDSLDATGERLYFQPWNILGGVNKIIPKQLHKTCLDVENWLRLQMSYEITPWIKHRLKNYTNNIQLIDEYKQAVAQADLVIATGGGYINDSFNVHCDVVLKNLQLAQHLGKPTALLGHGIGPLTNQQLKKLASKVLKQVHFIGLREGLLSCQILKELGVDEERIVVTGDDAIELVYQNRSPSLGTNIGVNLRISSYSPVGKEQIKTIHLVLNEFTHKVGSQLESIPISYNPKEFDLKSIDLIINGQNTQFKNEEPIESDLITPQPKTIINKVGTCRMVITGSYHAAVFALAQGIPAIGLSKSEYYVHKFTGLQKQFGEGLEHLVMDSPNFEAELRTALEKAWNSAETVRPKLLEAAQKQINQGMVFYNQVIQLIK